MTDPAEPRNDAAVLVLRSTAWQWVFKVLTLGVAFVSISVVTRLMGASDYGRLGVVVTYVGFVVALSDLGLPMILTRDMARAPEQLAGHVTTAMFGRALLVVPMYAVALAIAVPLYRHDPPVLAGIAVGLATLLPGSVTTTLTSVLQVESRLHVSTALELGAQVLTLAGMVAVLRNGGSLAAVVAVTVAVAALQAVVLARMLRRHLGHWSAWDSALFRRLVRTSLPLGIALVLNSLYFRVDTIILSLLRPATDVGVYVVAYRVMETILVFPSLFAAAALPVLSRAAVADGRLMGTIAQCLRAVVAVLLPMVVVASIEARPILVLLGGEEFARGDASLRILAFAALASGFNIVLGLAIIALNRHARALWINVSALSTNVVLNLLLVRRGGPPAAAAVTLGCEAAVIAGASYVVRQGTGAFPRVPSAGRLVLSAAVAAALLYVLPDGLHVVVRAALAGIAYVAGCLVTRAVTADDLRLLRATVSRQ